MNLAPRQDQVRRQGSIFNHTRYINIGSTDHDDNIARHNTDSVLQNRSTIGRAR